jgi:hypothetical protein
MPEMTLTIAGTSFDQHEYDGRGDVNVRFILDRDDAITVTLPPDHPCR